MDEFGTSPNHVSSVAELAQLAVDPGADIKFLPIGNLVGGYDPRAKRCAAVKSLSST